MKIFFEVHEMKEIEGELSDTIVSCTDITNQQNPEKPELLPGQTLKKHTCYNDEVPTKPCKLKDV